MIFNSRWIQALNSKQKIWKRFTAYLGAFQPRVQFVCLHYKGEKHTCSDFLLITRDAYAENFNFSEWSDKQHSKLRS